jgi:crotonobetainyl-CoA:carnitine CoA-transferase CaiB-like acyl-CoA transferase
MQPPSNQPLSGLRVLDLSRVLAGPFCSMVLGDLGAEVIKVERPGRGDDTREWGPPFHDGMSAYFISVNRNKRSITLDLARPAARAVLDRLVARSDVLIENFLPATAAKLGLDAARLERLNPRLVVSSITGFGRSGAWQDAPGYDFVVQALSGLMAITGEPQGAPMKVGVALTDVLTGLYAAVAILAELRARDSTAAQAGGRGDPADPRGGAPADASRLRHIDLALFDCTLAALVNVVQGFLVSGQRPDRYGNAHPHIVPYECFETADGYLVLAVGNDDQWRRFCAAAALSDLAADERFGRNPGRVTHRAELVPRVARALRSRTTAAWESLLTAAEVPHAPVLGVDRHSGCPPRRHATSSWTARCPTARRCRSWPARSARTAQRCRRRLRPPAWASIPRQCWRSWATRVPRSIACVRTE